MTESNDISLFGITDVGKVRQNNEDCFLIADKNDEHKGAVDKIVLFSLTGNNVLFMVSDGMGGAAAGEVASLTTVSTIKDSFFSLSVQNNSEIIEAMEGSLHQANKLILEKTKTYPEFKGMGATATLASIFDTTLFVSQVGDSRCYLLRGNKMTQITKDQSFVTQLVEEGLITEEEAKHHPKKNIILQALGSEINSLKVASSSVMLFANDYIILCSDGLSGCLPDNEIQNIILKNTDIEKACFELVLSANNQGGKDNITVIIAHLEGKRWAVCKQDEPVSIKQITEFF